MFGVFAILILAFYFLLDADTIVRAFVRLFSSEDRLRVEDACRRVSYKVSGWLGGQLLLGSIIGATAALALFLMGVPYFYVLALIAGIGEMIPIVGPLLAAIPAIAVAFTVFARRLRSVWPSSSFSSSSSRITFSFRRSWSGRSVSARSS